MTPLTTRALRALRQEMGLTQAELAARSGLSQGYLSQLESENHAASVEAYRRLAAGVGIPFCALLSRLGLDCGCDRDWGELSRYPVMKLFGRLSERQAAAVVALMEVMTDRPRESAAAGR